MFDLLDKPYPITSEQIAFYRDNGYIKLKNVLSPDLIEHYGKMITDAVVDLNTMHLPMEERSTYDRAFLQVTNLWCKREEVKPFVFSKRLARVAADLLETTGARLYHDQALYKEPGGGHTPWHADQFYWPLATDRSITAWIPLQETPLEMGPVEFSARSHNITGGRDIEISDQSDHVVETLLENHDGEHVVEPFEPGEVSFHAGWLFHRAGPNRSESTRRVMCVIYMDSEMRLKAPENEAQGMDRKAWCPDVSIGSVIDAPLTPVLFERE